MAIRITEDGVVNYENNPDVNRKLFPNLNVCGKEIDKLEEEIDGKAPAVFSATSGSTASFDDGANDLPLKSCVVRFGPIQGGTGDPSPENVRPISGRTGVNLWRTKRNLLPSEDGSYKTLSSSSIYFPDSPVWLPAGTYYIGVYRKASTEAHAGIYLKINDGSYNRIGSNVSIQFGVRSFTLGTGAFVTFRLYSSNPVGAEYRFILTNSLLTSDVDEFEPYQGNSYSVNWETEAGSVYGGTLDLVSGTLVVDYFKYSPLSSYTPSQFTSLGTYTRAEYSGVAVKPGVNASVPYTGVYSHGSYDNGTWEGDYSHAFCTDAGVGYFYLPCEADASVIQAYLKSQEDAGTPVTVAYKIATPIEIQLTPQEVRTLLGENNIWSDAGDVSVDYPVDTKTYIDELSIKTVEVSGQSPVITAEENTRYICGEVTSLSFTPSEKGICDVRFTAASISTVLTLPETVKLPDWFDPTLLEANTTYEINIVDGVYGVVMSWA